MLLAASVAGIAQDTTTTIQDTATTTITTAPALGSTATMEMPRLRTPMTSKTRFGLHGGINMARLLAKEFTGTADPGTKNKTSYHVGAFVNIPLGGMLKLQPELVFSSQGAKMEETATAGGTTRNYSYEEDLDYVNLPVMLQLQTIGGFFVETGPQFSYLIDAKQKGMSPISTIEETDLDPFRDNFDIGWGLGVGYLSRIGLGAHARYNYGIRNIVQENDTNVGELRNSVLQFGLVYQFGAYR